MMSHMIGTGRKWGEVWQQAANLGKCGFSLTAIKEWRTQEHDAGRSSSLEDFYRAHGICIDCKCMGLQVTGWDEENKEQLWSTCPTCEGTGRVRI